VSLLERIADLHRQATVERSHYYVGSILMESADRIMALEGELNEVLNRDTAIQAGRKALEDEVKELEALVEEAMHDGLDEYWVTCDEGKAWLTRAAKALKGEGE